MSREKSNSKRLAELLKMASVEEVKAPVMEISGTFIRDAIRYGKDVSWFVPAPAWKYLQEMHFYR
jgi:nicotinate-nucleotide adenylyltransferase